MGFALSDIKVIEYGEFISAPFCSKLLADLGADVIKIEKPSTGDVSRRRGPFLDDIPGLERSGFYNYLNTNKRGITLDITKATGKAIFEKLISDADILIEDTKPGYLSKIGLGFRHLKSIYPKLVVTSISAFGQTGPYKHRKGSDLTAWQMGGPGYVTPRFIGDAEKEPLRALNMASYICGISAAVATMCALSAQRRDGRGQQVDVSQLEAMIYASGFCSIYWPYEHRSASRADRRAYFPENHFRCKDGYAFIHAVNPSESHWQRFVEIMDNPDWASDDLFRTGTSRAEFAEALYPLIDQWMSAHSKHEVFEDAKAKKVPLAPANSTEELAENRQLKARGFFQTLSGDSNEYLAPGAPYKLSATPWAVRTQAPTLGQHNEEVYCGELGYSRRELVKLYEAGII